MKSKFTLENPMPPIWMRYPEISQYSIGWRMGYGEGYKWQLFDWLKELGEEQSATYNALFPRPIFWRNMEEDMDLYEYELIPFWTKNGEQKYSRERLLTSYHQGEEIEYLFFWKPSSIEVGKYSLGQWQLSTFDVDIETYSCMEQYMMAEKARLFEDEETEQLIMMATEPSEMKALGQKVKNFKQAIWDKVKYSIILNGNYYKFTQNKEMRDFLLSTGDKVLVEASPYDKIWGIGLKEEDENTTNPTLWNGSNLLGFALMEVRDELNRLYKNEHLINWEQFK